MREIADVRVHGTTGEAPLMRFEREEATALQRLDGRPPFRQVRELVRRVQADCAIEVDGNSYSVPWRLIGESVRVVVAGGRVRIHHGGAAVAVHAETTGRRQPSSTRHTSWRRRRRPAGLRGPTGRGRVAGAGAVATAG
jgi:hypothetical protein